MVSNWQIRATSGNSCLVEYDIKMEFASVVYSAITSQFFDFLVANINS